jgi:hypothetical protein
MESFQLAAEFALRPGQWMSVSIAASLRDSRKRRTSADEPAGMNVDSLTSAIKDVRVFGALNHRGALDEK